jgi:hypothetical protein
MLTAMTTTITDVVNACLLWSFEQTHTMYITHYVPTVKWTITFSTHHCAFIPAYHIVILTAATSAAQAAAAAAPAAAIATVAVSATGCRLPIITS